MRTIADHLFDILENSVNAHADKIIVKLSFDGNLFYCHVIDNGIPSTLDNIVDPFVTSRKTRKVGLGLPLLKSTSEGTGGYIKISYPNKDKGTSLEFSINMKSIDARPFGNLAAVFSDAIRSWEGIHLQVMVKKLNCEDRILDTAELRRFLQIDHLNHEEILNYVKGYLTGKFLEVGIDQQFGSS